MDDRQPARDLIDGLETEISNLKSIGKQLQEHKSKKVNENMELAKEQGRRPRTLDFRNEPPLDYNLSRGNIDEMVSYADKMDLNELRILKDSHSRQTYVQEQEY